MAIPLTLLSGVKNPQHVDVMPGEFIPNLILAQYDPPNFARQELREWHTQSGVHRDPSGPGDERPSSARSGHRIHSFKKTVQAFEICHGLPCPA
jgi:hypothetical protein